MVLQSGSKSLETSISNVFSDEDTDEKGAPQSGDGAVKSSGGDGSTPPVVVAEPIPLVDGGVGNGQAGLDSGQPKEEEKGGGWFSGFGVTSLTSTIQNTVSEQAPILLSTSQKSVSGNGLLTLIILMKSVP